MGAIYLGSACFILINVVLELLIRYRHLADMLKALKRSSLFASVNERSLSYQGRLFKAMLIIDIGTALFFSRSNVRNGALDPVDVAEFPFRLRVMAVGFVVSLYGSLLLAFICVALSKLMGFIEPDAYVSWHEFSLFISGSVAFLMFVVSVFLSAYAVQCHLQVMLNAIKKDHPYRTKLEEDLRWHGTSWRSVLFVLMCRALAANGRKLRNLDADVFDLKALPASFKWTARANIICVWTGIATALIALVLYVFW